MAEAQVYAGRERRLARPSPLVVAAAAAGLAAIAFVTLCPIGLRPRLASPDVERFCAYAVLGGLIALAAGRRTLAAMAGVIAVAAGLEAAQELIPGRDPMLSDAIVKALGGLIGCAAIQARYPLRRVLTPAPTPAPVRIRERA